MVLAVLLAATLVGTIEAVVPVRPVVLYVTSGAGSTVNGTAFEILPSALTTVTL